VSILRSKWSDRTTSSRLKRQKNGPGDPDRSPIIAASVNYPMKIGACSVQSRNPFWLSACKNQGAPFSMQGVARIHSARQQAETQMAEWI
jgi:hypothetical protein